MATPLAQLGEIMVLLETHFARYARSLAFTIDEWALVLGAVLGDGHLLGTTAGNCLRINHSLAQAAYVDWKYNRLMRFVRTAPRVCGGAYYFRTITHPQLTDLARSFYSGGRKGLPSLDVFRPALTPLTLAVWFMDDGTRDGNQVRFNTQCFEENEAASLQLLLLAHFGVRSTLNVDKAKPRIRICAASMPRFKELVGPHLLPMFAYKIP